MLTPPDTFAPSPIGVVAVCLLLIIAVLCFSLVAIVQRFVGQIELFKEHRDQ